MGNYCCGPEEDYKHGAWYSNDDDGYDHENHAGAFGDDEDAEYNAKATDREQLILLHEQQKKSRLRGWALLRSSKASNRRVTRNKRMSITSTPMDITSSFSFEPPSFPKSDDTVKFLLDALADNFVFDSIEEEAKLQFVDAMQSQEFKQGDWIMHQGDVGDYFYIVEEGEVSFHVVGEDSTASSKDGNPDNFPPRVGTGSKGSTFGELALLYNTPRAASVRVLSPLKLYKIDQLTFRSLLMSQQVNDRTNIISLVQKLSIFQDLDGTQIRKLVDAFTIMEYSPGERIVNKGDKGSIFYIVKSGQVKVDDIGHGASKFQDQTLEEGDCFGERALITGETRAANVSAITKSSLLAISKDILEEILGPLDAAIKESSNSSYLQSIPLFQELTTDEIHRCVRHLKEESFEKGSKILAKGKLYLIQDGRALMMVTKKGKNGEEPNKNGGSPPKKESNGPTLVKLEKGDYFGDIWGSNEENDLPQDSDTKAEDIVNVEADMKCLTLLVVDIESVIGNMERVADCSAENQSKAREARMKYLKSRSESYDTLKTKKISTNRDVLNLSKLRKHRILGTGTFGKVWLVTPKSNTKDKPTPYALKMVSKRQILEQRLAPAVMREKNVMETIVHPLLARMASSFQDENYLYFVMDLILGGELFEIIYSEGAKPKGGGGGAWKDSAFYKSFGSEDDAKAVRKLGLAGLGVRQAVFYSACIIEAFAHLHNRRIVYRDLKPENVMLNEKGYCVVVDMGFAKVVLDKTYTMCGTPEYIAPEIIANIGHNHAADYWSFACILYELVVGQTPFCSPNLDQLSLLKKIVKANYKFPDKIIKLSSSSGSTGINKVLCQWKDLVTRLLKNKSAERLGNLRNGIEDILDHEMFENIDFNELRQQNIPAPWVPDIVDPMDTTHFANNFQKEEKPEYFSKKIPEKDQAVFIGF